MKRLDFINSILTLTGTAFVYGCKETIDLANIESVKEPLSMSDSKNWFESYYLPKMKNSTSRKMDDSINRSLNWDEGVTVNQRQENFIWLPVDYQSENQLPSIVTWQDGQEYIPKLAEYLKWSVAEGFIFYKNDNNQTEGYMIQIAYDPFKHKPGTPIESQNFTGMIIHADWNEQPSRVWRYLDGNLETYFDADKGSNAKTTCQNIYYSYQTVTGQSCGPNCTDVTYTLHREVYTICNGGSGGSGAGSGSSGGYPYYGGGGQGSGSSTPPTNSVYSPYINYNYYNIPTRSGIDYQMFMQRLNNTLTTLNISATTFGNSFTYADVFIKTLGMETAYVRTTSTALSTVSRRVGVAGIVVGTIQLAIAISDDGPIMEADYYNAAALALGVVSVFTPIGWLAITAGATSAAIGFYASSLPQ